MIYGITIILRINKSDTLKRSKNTKLTTELWQYFPKIVSISNGEYYIVVIKYVASVQ